MEKKDRNAKPGDNEIVTKKGFLISPPKKNNKKNFIFAIQPEANKNSAASNIGTNSNSASNDAQKNSSLRPKKPYPNKNNTGSLKKQDTGKNSNPTTNNNKTADNIDNNQQNIQNRPAKNHSNKFKDKKRPEKQLNNPAASTQKKRPEQAKMQKNDAKSTPQNKNSRQPLSIDRDTLRSGKEKEQAREQNIKQPHQSSNSPAQTNFRGTKDKNQSQKTAGKVNPSILSDLGFASNSFAKKNVSSENQTDEPAKKIDYSKAVPLRDQIYPPKKEIPEKSAKDISENKEKVEIIGVRFREAGKIYYFDPDKTEIPYGTPVIVETARGLEYGYTAITNRFIPADSIVSPLKKIVRPATKDDTERLIANRQLEKNARELFDEKVAKLGLEMSLVDVEYTFDNTKLLFYFAAETRIDFRELVKELASVFRTRIELRQVGVRDEAKMLGGLGICGRPLCCSTFLGEFAQVSIKMAKDQSLSLSSSKISGTCGRLLCCLRYEDEVYQQEYERTPKVDAIVDTEEGKGVVVETNPLKGIVRVRLDSKRDAPPQAFHRDSVKIVGYLHNSNNNTDAELKELEKE